MSLPSLALFSAFTLIKHRISTTDLTKPAQDIYKSLEHCIGLSSTFVVYTYNFETPIYFNHPDLHYDAYGVEAKYIKDDHAFGFFFVDDDLCCGINVVASSGNTPNLDRINSVLAKLNCSIDLPQPVLKLEILYHKSTDNTSSLFVLRGAEQQVLFRHKVLLCQLTTGLHMPVECELYNGNRSEITDLFTEHLHDAFNVLVEE
jgi:hypothetical protein